MGGAYKLVAFGYFWIDKWIHYGYTLDTMNTTTIHIKTDVKTRNEVKKIAEDFGFSLTSLVNALLKQIARTKHLDLNLEENPTQYMIDSLKKSEEEVKAGKTISFKSRMDILDYLSKEINNEK